MILTALKEEMEERDGGLQEINNTHRHRWSKASKHLIS